DFAVLSFKIKVETTDKETSAKLSFLDRNDEPIKKPKDVFVKDITKKKGKIKEPFSGLDFYLLNHPNKYVFYYDIKFILLTVQVKKIKSKVIKIENKSEKTEIKAKKATADVDRVKLDVDINKKALKLLEKDVSRLKINIDVNTKVLELLEKDISSLRKDVDVNIEALKLLGKDVNSNKDVTLKLAL
ncbi:10975_t:CDS:2, partial [Dentiscutata heterogama]